MPVAPLTLRLEKGSPLTPLEMDENLKLLRDFSNALEFRFEAALNPDGVLKDGAINDVDQIVDRLITNAKLNWLFNFYGVAAGTDTYTLSLSPTTGFSKGDGVATSLMVAVKFTNANTGAATLNINSDGAQPIVKNGATALSAGDIPAGSVAFLVWSGAAYQIIGLIAEAAGLIDLSTGVTGILGTANGGTGGPGRAFNANRAGTPQSGIGAGPAVVQWTASLFDVGTRLANLGTANARYVPDVAGYYDLTAMIHWSGFLANTDYTVSIYKTGVEVARNTAVGATTVNLPTIVNTIQQANGSSDYFDVRLTQNSGGNLTISGAVIDNYFCGHRVIA